MLAPLLKYLADALALSWRDRLTVVAHQRYLKGSTCYAASNLAGMQVSCSLHSRVQQATWYCVSGRLVSMHACLSGLQSACISFQLTSAGRLISSCVV